MLTRLLTFVTCAAFGTALPTAPGLHTWRAIGLQGAAPNATEWKLTTAGNRIVTTEASRWTWAPEQYTLYPGTTDDYAVVVVGGTDPHSFLLVDERADQERFKNLTNPLLARLGAGGSCSCSASHCAGAIGSCVSACASSWGVACFSCLSLYPGCCDCVGSILGSCSWC